MCASCLPYFYHKRARIAAHVRGARRTSDIGRPSLVLTTSKSVSPCRALTVRRHCDLAYSVALEAARVVMRWPLGGSSTIPAMADRGPPGSAHGFGRSVAQLAETGLSDPPESAVRTCGVRTALPYNRRLQA